MSFLSRLFGFSGNKEASKKGPEPTEHKGFLIFPTPRSVSGQWQIVGVIRLTKDETTLEQEFIRADTLPSEEEAIAFTVRKGKQIIDEMGENLFDN
ncbi:hypothetical protein E1162_17495 [Rhodobacteraceae bacterium RKSG542]|uniref:HlyU family transcriptional regulator n=1 Tax=Pseudovibrio flavus TaxID=2529854 RepID=UPI0012BD13DA|nr:HlyU family transcriptional regulator [Pseudovibrio flavus]MTI19040.1 hypothetical protein [Pseudovibrio flavus]